MSENTQPNIVKARYAASAVRADQYPEVTLPEIAFIGRSNVGKSSLINSLSRHSRLARTSGVPGKTQTINFYEIGIKLGDGGRLAFYLVDLPGYGYARAGRTARRQWAGFIEEYLTRSANLKLVCQLIDVRHPPQASDIAFNQWLKEKTSHSVQVIATKADKISKGQAKKHTDAIRAGLGLGEDRVLLYSSAAGTGREQLLDLIVNILLK